ASDAAKQPVPAEPKLKAMSELRIVGQRVKKVDAPDVVSGKAIYGIDARMPGMLYASIERPPTVGGTLVKFDATKAMKVRGVRSVVAIKAGVAVVAENSWAGMKGREALAITWEPGPNRAFNSDTRHGHFQAASAHQLRAAFDENNAPLFWGHKKVSSDHNLRGAPTAQERADVEYNQDSAWGVYAVPYAFPSIEATYLSIDVPVP